MALPLVYCSGWSLPATTLAPLAMRIGGSYALLSPSAHPPEDLPARFVGIGHSLGGLWLLHHYATQLAGFASLCSFPRFGWPVKTLQAMQAKLRTEREEVVQAFQVNMGCASPMPCHDSVETLQRQLLWLQTWDETAILQQKAFPTLGLFGARDSITKPQHWRTSDYDTHYQHPDAKHALPLTHPDWCAKHIKPWLSAC
jgi:pimeloyl-[acyl-carrier protein] methyl ester esterase